MGQMTYAVMLGVKKAPPAKLKEGWHSLVEGYSRENSKDGPTPDTPHGDGDHEILGFFVAVGASGHDFAPDLVNFPLKDFGKQEDYKGYLAACRRSWKRFAAWCESNHKITLGEPILYLVQTEVG
jgi:hypothetical protein